MIHQMFYKVKFSHSKHEFFIVDNGAVFSEALEEQSKVLKVLFALTAADQNITNIDIDE